MKKINKQTLIFVVISLILFIIPFFWLHPGEMDLGGDSNRLYFYDPISILKSFGIYSIAPYGTGIPIYSQYLFPFLLFIISLKSIFSSPTILIAIFNGFKLSGSFVFVFLIIKELLKKEEGKEITLAQFLAALLGSLFYTFSPSVIENMRYALITHSQVFLNPMIFYFILRYLITLSKKYIWLALLITFTFSSNFFLPEPPFVAFYSIALVFLFLYNFFVLRKPTPWKGIAIGILFFLGIHAFHIVPTISNLFDKGSEYNTRVFESAAKVNVGLEYFNAILPLGKVSEHLLLPLENQKLSWSLITIPALIILGFLSFKKRNRTILLVSIFFFITLFLVSANITQTGVEFYRKLFLIPGFGMFRNFYGQWQWVYTFFYAILTGLAVSYLFSKLRRKYTYIIFIVTISFLLARSLVVFNGNIVNVFNRGSKNVKVVIRMDPNYERMLAYIREIPNDGKIFHVPFTDNSYNIVGGSNKGVYVGQSMVSLLTGKNDFSGYQDIDPFSEVFVKLSREKKYPLIKQMMSLLQIRYVLYNSDEMISDTFFTTFPYGYTGVPASPSAALDFAHNISKKLIYKTGHYSLFEVAKEQYLPHFYAVSDVFVYNVIPKYDTKYMEASSFFPEKPLDINRDPRIAFVDSATCNKILSKEICDKKNLHTDIKNLQIIYQRVSPTKYKVTIKNATSPFLLVFQNSFSQHWKLYPSTPSDTNNIIDSYYTSGAIELLPENQAIDKKPFETNGKNSMYDNVHIQVNGYANAWYIKPSKLGDFSMIVEMTSQKLFYHSLGISGVCLLIFLLYGIKLLKK